MRHIYVFIPIAIWAIVCIVLKIVGLLDWWQATSFLWLPAGVAISAMTIIYGTALIGAKIKAKREREEKPDCEKCLYRKAQKMLNNEKCLGEEHNEPKADGVCKYWTRYRGK